MAAVLFDVLARVEVQVLVKPRCRYRGLTWYIVGIGFKYMEYGIYNSSHVLNTMNIC